MKWIYLMVLVLILAVLLGCSPKPSTSTPSSENVTPAPSENVTPALSVTPIPPPAAPPKPTPPPAPSAPTRTPTSAVTDAIRDERKGQILVFEARLRELLGKGILPIVDVESHAIVGQVPTSRLKELIARMDQNGVALAWLSPDDNKWSEFSLMSNRSYPDRIVPTTIDGSGSLWHSRDKDFLKKLAIDVRSGKYFVMGEFEARHYPSSTNDRDVHLPVDSESFHVVLLISRDRGSLSPASRGRGRDVAGIREDAGTISRGEGYMGSRRAESQSSDLDKVSATGRGSSLSEEVS